MQTPFSFLWTVVFVHQRTACSFLVVLLLGWAKGLRHYQLIALLGWPLLPRGNSTSSKFQGLEVLSPRDSLWSSAHEGSRRVTHASLRNSASVELQGKKCCFYKTPYIAAPIWVPRWRHREFYALCATSYRCTYKSQNSFFLFTSDVFCNRPVLSYRDSYVNFYEEVYEQRWYQKRTTYCISGGVTRRVP